MNVYRVTPDRHGWLVEFRAGRRWVPAVWYRDKAFLDRAVERLRERGAEVRG